MQRETGFTFIEIIIVIAIIALLAAVAYPSYVGQVQRSQRTDARAAVTRVANDLQRFFATNGRFTVDMSQLSLAMSNDVAHSENGHYAVSVAAGPTGDIATSYLITAVPTEESSQSHDEACPSFTLNSLGQRTPDPATTDCW